MPYKVTILENEGIIQTELIGEFSKQDISAYVQDLLSLDFYHQYGRLLVDYKQATNIPADFNEFMTLTEPMKALQIKGREIWQAGVNAAPVFVGISRQVNTLLELSNDHLDKVNLKFFDSKDDAKTWLKSKPVN